MDYSSLIHKAATQPHLLTDSDFDALRMACREYPADSVAPAILLKYADGLLTDKERAYARARVSLYNGCPAEIVKMIDPSGKGFDSFYPPLPAENRPDTSGAIDVFLETYGRQTPEETAMLERMIFNPVPDYSEVLARTYQEEEEEKTEQKEPLPPPPAPRTRKTNVAPTPSLLSESLAKIFIKQGRYERAHEIISNLSLNYPEKSVYFADQLRFLEKLIINGRYAR